MSKLGWLAIVYLLLYTMTEPFRFFYGPMSINFCFAKTTLGSVILLQILMLIMSMTVTKYLFVFVLKNPLAIEDDFWCAFISRWIFSTGFLVQILVGMLPGKFDQFSAKLSIVFIFEFISGKEPIYFYLCCGLKPPEDDLSNPKVRILQIIVLFGILSSLLLVFKVEHFKKRNKLKISGQNLENHACGRVNEHQFEGVAKLFSTTLIFVLTLFFQFILNKIPPQDLNVFPGNLAEHIFRVYWTNLISSFLYFTHFKRQKVDQ